MATMANITQQYIETVDSNQDLTIQCATIQSLFESTSPQRQRRPDQIQFSNNDGSDHHYSEDELRRVRGTIIDNKTNKVVFNGGFFPYEYTEGEQDKFEEKMVELDHKIEDLDIGYSYEGTIIRIFYHKQWYVSTHRKLDSGRSKWGSNNSFKFLFEEGLKSTYNMSLKDLFSQLNLRCQYTFMIMADENTRFVCDPHDSKKVVYFVGSNDPDEDQIKIDRLPKPESAFENLEEIFDFVKGMKYPFTHQGLLLVHSDGSQYRIISDEYEKMFRVRNNEQSIPYRYLQLKGQNNQEMIDLLKQLFPKYISTFESYDQYILKLADIIYHEYNKRKQRSLLPLNLTTMHQIDQRLYLFIKNKLLTSPGKNQITRERILELLRFEEPSNLNHMIQKVKYDQRKESVLNQTPDEPIKLDSNQNAPMKKKKVKFSRVPIEFSCRKKLF